MEFELIEELAGGDWDEDGDIAAILDPPTLENDLWAWSRGGPGGDQAICIPEQEDG